MIRSRVTLAITDAAAMQATVASPFGTASAGMVRPRTGKPSVSAYAGAGVEPGQRAPHPLQVAARAARAGPPPAPG